MADLTGKIVLLTGSSKGIGAATVRALGAAGAWWLWLVFRRWTPDPRWSFWRAVLPGLSIQGVLLALYFAHVVPPVPLAVRFIGVYHGLKRVPGTKLVELYRETPDWMIWRRHGDTVFRARPGDRIWLFARVFAPRNFRDGLVMRSAFHDPRNGWLQADVLPMSITGGQAEGWGAVAYKDHYTPGLWKMEVETGDGRPVGSLQFTVVADEETDARVLALERH